MTDILWALVLACATGAGMAGGLSSCYREQGDHERAQTYAGLAVVLVVLALGAAGAAWSLK